MKTFKMISAVGIFVSALLMLPSSGVGPSSKWMPSAWADSGHVHSTPSDDIFSGSQQDAIEKIVRNYLLKHPELMMEMQDALQIKLRQAQTEKFRAFLTENHETIFRNSEDPVAGDPNGDITIVEFFDYNCSYCKKGMSDVQKLIETDKRVRVVFKELPVLSKGSEEASKVALAARRQGKYWDFHQAMFAHKGIANEASALAIAERIGLDMQRLKQDMASDMIADEIRVSKLLSDKLNVVGTPHFLVGDKSLAGASNDLHGQLETLVADLRKSGCTRC
ncbi:disulfide bond formation protein DsbA [Hyphomicrobium methylovorum]|uniref:DsbA family protein n=1 Tax=Hyphomicrobium methylovorum TaxID=84 RepID=UPI0015E7582E|nr:DsbA family protein [Hyphomicrobium methylovorum]MBA2125862.1 disulfide bond formation protein DsbA [Hyphomicrobium methylovorum]